VWYPPIPVARNRRTASHVSSSFRRTNPLRTWRPPSQPSGSISPRKHLCTSPSGPCSFRRSAPVSGFAPPVPFGATLRRRVRLRRVPPSGKGPDWTEALPNLCPPGVFPSEALPFVAVDPASRLLLSRAWWSAGRSQLRVKPTTSCTSESYPTTNPVACAPPEGESALLVSEEDFAPEGARSFPVPRRPPPSRR
jgi:hypothetical protein